MVDKTPDEAFELVLPERRLDGLLARYPELCRFELECFAAVFQNAEVTRTKLAAGRRYARRFSIIRLAAAPLAQPSRPEQCDQSSGNKVGAVGEHLAAPGANHHDKGCNAPNSGAKDQCS